MTFSAVLLAGGESSRMGTDKATLVFAGEPLWQRQLGLLREIGVEKIFVSARNERPWRPAETELLLDRVPSRGPGSGLTRALEQIQTSHLLALAVDMPFITAAHLRFVCDLAGPGCGVLPMIDKRAEPLAAIYPHEAVDYFRAALAGADHSLQKVTRALIEAG
ncbi:MAG TPA: molybdenum cofactor guanylyltransferase, partial [Chthoniobacterales bacterium]